MDDIASSNPAFILLPKPQQRFRGVAGAGFHLNGIYLVFHLAVVGYQEVDFNIVAPLFVILVGIEEQAMSIGYKHLGNRVII